MLRTIDYGVTVLLGGSQMKSVLSVFVSLLALSSVAQAKLEIVGGNGVADGSAVAQTTVAIYFANHVLCTSTIIAPNVLLTAAHCVVDEDGQAGVVIFGTSLEKQDLTLRHITGVVMPNDYVADTTSDNRNDIALVKFDGDLPAGYHPANLPTSSVTVADGALLTVAGYGKTDVTNDDSAGTLFQTNTKVMSVEVELDRVRHWNEGSGRLQR